MESSNLRWIKILDLFTALIFIMETTYYLMIVPGKYFNKIFNTDRIIELINIIELFYSYATV